MTNQEMLLAAIEFEEVEFSADLFYLIQSGIVNANEEFNVTDKEWNKVDRKISGEYIKNNILGFNIVNLYCIRLNVDDHEIFAAQSDEQAKGYILNKYGTSNGIVKMDKSKWLKEFWIPERNEYVKLMDLRKENNKFPRQLFII